MRSVFLRVQGCIKDSRLDLKLPIALGSSQKVPQKSEKKSFRFLRAATKLGQNDELVFIFAGS